MRWGSKMASVAAVSLLLVVPGLAFAAPVLSLPTLTWHGPYHSTTTSGNWAGYAVTGSKGSVTFVNGSWTVPTVTGCRAGSSSYSSFWVGIDGYSSSSVEQTGTDSDCHGATAQYYAWYEFYPKPSHTISTLTIHAGDVIYASVSFASAKFTVTLRDNTTGLSFSTSAAVASAQRSSAEWIAEAPASFSTLPLANFGTVNFGFDTTALPATNSATLNGTTGLLGSFSTAVSIDMVGVHHASLVKAQTSAISSDLSSFSITWKARGP
ncbi:MAG TPA: G1 family glutamic endopeptidase [Thermoplasmata archaeon]